MADAPLLIEFHHAGNEPLDAPVPVPMRRVLPEWFGKMPASVPENLRQPSDVTHLTLRACAPFVAAMTSGYALLWPSTMTITLAGRRPNGDYDIRFEPAKPAILMSHPPRQTPGMPSAALPIVKLLQPWIMRTPEGTSCLFMPLVNRPEVPIIPFSAVVETDRYFAPVHLPFLLVPQPSGQVTIERGQPIAQILPFRREDWASVRGEGDAEAAAHTRAVMQASPDGAYAKAFRAPRSFQ
jgi:hypothetical protein